MKIAVACGGTGGHIFPGLATADELMARGHDVTLWLAGKDVEHEAVMGWGGPVVTVPAQGFPSGLSMASAGTAIKLFKAISNVKSAMQPNKPDVVLAMGSYASVGPVGAAIRLGIPFVMHESNVIPGRAVRLLSRWAAVVAGCFDETRFYLRKRNLVLTGMPLRREVLREAGQLVPALNETRLLVMGGSRGAHRLNELVSQALVQLHREHVPFSVVHLTGEPDQTAMEACYKEAGVKAEVLAFTRDVGAIYARTDFAVCRAGAATCAELAAFGIPSLLIPYPHAIHDHQTANARALEKAGAADTVPEMDVTVDWLVSYLGGMLQKTDRRVEMAAASRARSSGDGVKELADLVEHVARDPAYGRR